MVALKKGMKFKSPHFNGTYEILSIYDDEEGYEIVVECLKDGSTWEETWDGEVTCWGFDLGEYQLIEE